MLFNEHLTNESFECASRPFFARSNCCLYSGFASLLRCFDRKNCVFMCRVRLFFGRLDKKIRRLPEQLWGVVLGRKKSCGLLPKTPLLLAKSSLLFRRSRGISYFCARCAPLPRRHGAVSAPFFLIASPFSTHDSHSRPRRPSARH